MNTYVLIDGKLRWQLLLISSNTYTAHKVTCKKLGGHEGQNMFTIGLNRQLHILPFLVDFGDHGIVVLLNTQQVDHLL